MFARTVWAFYALFILPGSASATPIIQAHIKYVASDKTMREAWLQKADVIGENFPVLGHLKTIDAEWVVHNPDGQEPAVQWIYVLATDHSVRKVRTACTYHSPPQSNDPTQSADVNADQITCDFVYANPDGSDEHREDHIYLLGQDRKPFYLRIAPASGPFPTPPGMPAFLIGK